jgi:hypothetical protein
MNLALLCIIIPLACLLLHSDVWLFKQVYAMTDVHRNGIFGGLSRNKLIFSTWCASFALSSVGICCSFYIHVFFSSGPNVIFIFAGLNIALVVYNSALLEQNTTMVFLCLVVILIYYVLLFVYTLYLFPVDGSVLLWATHVCNFICILHALFLDIFIWQSGWWQYIDRPDTECHPLLVEEVHSYPPDLYCP